MKINFFRVIVAVVSAVDAAFDGIKAARAPESDGGVRVTLEEVGEIVEAVLDRIRKSLTKELKSQARRG